MLRIQIYIEGERITLFDDENIFLNSSVQNIRDITKTSTDFTQTFTVPASAANNLIFKHWWNADITGGFDSRKRIPSTIEIGFQPFKGGLIQLEGSNLKQGVVNSYKITFFGNLVSLTDLFGDDKLSQLDLSALDHNLTFSNVELGMTTENLLGDEVMYPPISTKNFWQWGGNSDPDAKIVNIRNDGNPNDGIDFKNLKLAIRISKIIEAIKSKYSITFSNEFFGLNHFQKIWMWCMNDKSNLFDKAPNGQATLLPLSNSTGTGWKIESNRYVVPVSGNFDGAVASILVDPDFIGIQYGIGAFKNNFDTFLGSTVPLFGSTGAIPIFPSTAFNAGDEIIFTYDTLVNTNIQFKANGIEILGIGVPDNTVDSIVEPLKMRISEQIPDIKVTDFFAGIVKMFNLVILPTGKTNFLIDTLDDFYDAGKIIDITEFVDIGQVPIDAIKLARDIEFIYQESETILAKQFRETNNGIGYGDLKATSEELGLGEANTAPPLKIKLPFENLLLERLTQVDGSEDSFFHSGTSLDVEGNTIIPKPYLFYDRGLFSTGIRPYNLLDEDGNITIQDKYHNIGPEDDAFITNTTKSLNWGAEIGSFDLTERTNSLFSDFQEDFITDLYDPKRRLFKFKAILPQSILTTLKLNDQLIISRRKYIINNMNTNLRTGETKFELLNFID